MIQFVRCVMCPLSFDRFGGFVLVPHATLQLIVCGHLLGKLSYSELISDRESS